MSILLKLARRLCKHEATLDDMRELTEAYGKRTIWLRCRKCDVRLEGEYGLALPVTWVPTPLDKVIAWLRMLPTTGLLYRQGTRFHIDCQDAAEVLEQILRTAKAARRADTTKVYDQQPRCCKHNVPYNYACEECDEGR